MFKMVFKTRYNLLFLTIVQKYMDYKLELLKLLLCELNFYMIA